MGGGEDFEAKNKSCSLVGLLWSKGGDREGGGAGVKDLRRRKKAAA